MGSLAINKIFVFAVSIALASLLGLMIEICMNSIQNKWCLYDPWYLLFKNMSVYIIIFFETNLLLAISHKITRPSGIISYKRTIKSSLQVLLLGAFIAFGYSSWFYGNYGAGACAKPNININYYKYPGQEKYLK